MKPPQTQSRSWFRLPVLALWLYASVSVGASSLLCGGSFADLAPRIAGLPQFSPAPIKNYYFANGNPNSPLTFSFEIELTPDKNPNLVRYYRLPSVSEANWKRLTEQERLRLFKERLTQLTKDDVVMVRLPSAPEYLAPELFKETRDSDRVELSYNGIFLDLNTLFKSLDWIWSELGPGSLQGHVVFPIEGTTVKGADNYIKLDFDIAQAEALAYGYLNYKQSGIPPGRNLTHRSLGPMDKPTLDTISKELGQPKLTKRESTDRKSKFVYGIVYRPELYGPGNAGFEIRNTHNRLESLKYKMRKLAEAVEDGFVDYRSPERNSRAIILSADTLPPLPDRYRTLFEKAGKTLEERNAGENVGGAPFAQRFALPFLAWEDHPYIAALPKEDRARFQGLLKDSLSTFQKTLDGLAQSATTPESLAEELRIAVSRWGYDSQLALYLRFGEAEVFRVP